MCKSHLTDREAVACCPHARPASRIPFWTFQQRNQRGLTDEEVRTLGLQRCPRCRIVIEKNGGCNQMTCRCGARFRWTNGRNRDLNGVERFFAESSPAVFYTTVTIGTPLVAALAVAGAGIGGAILLVRTAVLKASAPRARRVARIILASLAAVAVVAPSCFVGLGWCVAGVAAVAFISAARRMRYINGRR